MIAAHLVDSMQSLAVNCHWDPACCEATCLSPSVGWLSPRLSFSKDFAQPEDTVETGDTAKKGKQNTDRDSMSEFEFAMSMLEDEEATGSCGLAAADDLFFKGKMLPLYIPQYMEGQEEEHPIRCGRAGGEDQREALFELKCSPRGAQKTVQSSVSGKSVIAKESVCVPVSPKTPTCSTKLRVLLGLKKVNSHCMPPPQVRATSGPQNKAHLASRAKRLFCMADDCKVLDARSSAAESVTACKDGIERIPACKDGIEHEQEVVALPSGGKQETLQCSGLILEANDPICDGQVGATPHMTEVNVRPDQIVMARRRMNPEHMRSVSYGGRGTIRARRVCDGSSETSPARRSSGALSPARSSGHWSPARHSSGGRSSPAYSPSRLSFGEHMEGHRLLRARSLERSNSYSPKSLQRKYDQLKTLRQREGWRILERSSSYNMNSMRVAPILNVPIVCLTRSRNSSSNNTSAYGHANGKGSSCNANAKGKCNGSIKCKDNVSGGSRLGQFLFSAKATSNGGWSDYKKADHPKSISNVVQGRSTSRRDH